MKKFFYTINGKEIELATNNDGSNLFQWSNSEASWKQIAAGQILNKARIDDEKYCRRAVYNYYRR